MTGYYYKRTVNAENGVTTVDWVQKIEDATELSTTLSTTNGSGGNIIVFTGLADGTYTLKEKTVPAGYNKAPDRDITIASNEISQTNLEKGITIQNSKGNVLPHTGGAGLYVVAGVALLALLAFGGTALLKKRVTE